MADESDRSLRTADATATGANFNPADFQSGAPADTIDSRAAEDKSLQNLGFPAGDTLLPGGAQVNQDQNQEAHEQEDDGSRTLEDGTKVETLKKENGDFETRFAHPDGSKRTLTVQPDGHKEERLTKPDGSFSLTRTRPDNSVEFLTRDARGNTEQFDTRTQRGVRVDRGPGGELRITPLNSRWRPQA